MPWISWTSPLKKTMFVGSHYTSACWRPTSSAPPRPRSSPHGNHHYPVGSSLGVFSLQLTKFLAMNRLKFGESLLGPVSVLARWAEEHADALGGGVDDAERW